MPGVRPWSPTASRPVRWAQAGPAGPGSPGRARRSRWGSAMRRRWRRSAALPSRQAPPSLPLSDAAARRGPWRGPRSTRRQAITRRRASRPPGRRGPGLDRLPGPLRQQPGCDQAAHGLLEGVVVPLLLRPVVLAPGEAVSWSSTVPTVLTHSGVRSPWMIPAPWNVVWTFTDRSSKSWPGSWSGSSGRHRASISAASPARSRKPIPAAGLVGQDLVGLIPLIRRQLVGPGAQRPGVGFRDLFRGQRRVDLRMPTRPAAPTSCTKPTRRG